MSARKATALRMTMTRSGLAASLMLGALAPTTGWALPQGGTVAAGSASVTTPSPTSMRIDQTTDRLIIDWARFNIAANESVRFQQPSVASIALNRVAGYEASGIFGLLSANGQLIISNSSGILFGPNSRVDVGALTATTLTITNQDFLAGRYRFTQDPAHGNAAVVSQGVITAGAGGYVALLGAAVRNEGVIQANLGSVALGAGKAATLDLLGDGMIGFVVTEAVPGRVTGPHGESLAAYVSNTGILQADGGTVILTANAVRDVIGSVVNQEGVVKATSLVNHGGVVKLLAEGESNVAWNKGTIDVSAGEANAAPGTVLVSGPYAGQSGTILAKGADGAAGGRVEVTSSRQTILFSGSTIDVSGTGNGTAGSVRVWSDKETVFAKDAAILARGGDLGGDGGFVEVSGLQNLHYRGFVDLSAPNGKWGTLLLDPLTITIADGSGGADDAQVTAYGYVYFGNSAASDFTISEQAIEGFAGNVLLQARNSITLNNLSDGVLLLGSNRNLTLQTRNDATAGDSPTGGITFVNPANTIQAQGSGTITIQAGVDAVPSGRPYDYYYAPGYVYGMLGNAHAIVGNLTTDGGAVTVQASGQVSYLGTITIGGVSSTPGSGSPPGGSGGTGGSPPSYPPGYTNGSYTSKYYTDYITNYISIYATSVYTAGGTSYYGGPSSAPGGYSTYGTGGTPGVTMGGEQVFEPGSIRILPPTSGDQPGAEDVGKPAGSGK